MAKPFIHPFVCMMKTEKSQWHWEKMISLKYLLVLRSFQRNYLRFPGLPRKRTEDSSFYRNGRWRTLFHSGASRFIGKGHH